MGYTFYGEISLEAKANSKDFHIVHVLISIQDAKETTMQARALAVLSLPDTVIASLLLPRLHTKPLKVLYLSNKSNKKKKITTPTKENS